MQHARVIGFLVVPLIAAAVHVAVARVRNQRDVSEIFLRYVLGISVGVNGIFAFIGHFFFSDMVAASIGWPAGSYFQLEVAFTNLALGVLGVLSVWYRGGFRVATAVAATTFLFGASVVHLMDLVASGNNAAGNLGLVVPSNVVRPLLIIGLLAAQARAPRPAAAAAVDGTPPLNRQAADSERRASARAGAAVGSCVVVGGLVAGFVSGDWALWVGTSVPIGVAVGAGLHVARLRAPTA